MLDKLEALYVGYLSEFRRLEQGRKPLEGAFGLGSGPRSYPCHDKFAQDLERLLRDLAARSPSSEEVSQALNYIYFTAPARFQTGPAVDWMLLAVHGLTLELIGLLDAAEAAPLCRAYGSAYPRLRRLPVQNKLFAALQKRGGTDRRKA